MAFDNARVCPKRIFLFDVDGTLTPARLEVLPDMRDFLKELRAKVLSRSNLYSFVRFQPLCVNS